MAAEVVEKAENAVAQEDSPYAVKAIEPFLTVIGGAQAVEFYKKALGAEQLMRYDYNERKDGEEEPGIMSILKVGPFKLMVGDESPEPIPGESGVSPAKLSGSPVSLQLVVGNADKFFARAIAEGAKPIVKVHDAFWGDRYGQFEDPFGHRWGVTHLLPKPEAPADPINATEKAG